MEVDKIVNEYKELQELIKQLTELLQEYSLQSKVIKEELMEISDKYNDVRKSEIIPVSADLNIEDMIAKARRQRDEGCQNKR